MELQALQHTTPLIGDQDTHTQSMTLSLPPTESMILSAHAEDITLSAGSAKQQSTESCSGKCGNNGGGRGDSGGSNEFDIGSGDNNCSDNSMAMATLMVTAVTVTMATTTALRVPCSQRAALRVSYSQHRL
jgi:hypothetical protein